MKLTKAFVEEIRALIIAARSAVVRSVDLVQVQLNFEIGRRMVEQEQQGKGRAAYGKEVLNALAEKLSAEFGTGFSRSNLAYMRSFYLLYHDRVSNPQIDTGRSGTRKKVQTASGQLVGQPIIQTPSGRSTFPFTLSWSHYVFLLGIKNADERRFYELEATDQNWTLRELKRQFSTSLYERLALSRDKAGIRKLARKGHVVEKPHDILKEPLVLEFLGLDEQARFSESELESAIISRIEHFLLELGKGFLFEARQKRFTFDGDHFFVDLVFYNRLLRCYVLIDLKLDQLTHQDLGQMQMYVNAFDRQIKLKDENPTIGIVLCKKKNDALVEITLPRDANIQARAYQLYLPSKEVLRRKLQEWAEEAGGE